MDDLFTRSIEMTTEAIRSRPTVHWVVVFSGGKDSSAALKIFIAAYLKSNVKLGNCTIIYCDTGVEDPILDIYVKNLLSLIRLEFHGMRIPFDVKLLKAPVQDRFFVRIIGRGYPPPTNNFRWCTTGLCIRPVSAFTENQDPTNTVVVLGLRKSESLQRDRSLALSKDIFWQKQREGRGDYDLFLPIVELDVPQV